MPAKKAAGGDARLDVELLRRMLLIRRFEEKAAQMYGLKKIGGFCHLYIGQEATAVGAIAAIDLSKDYVVAAYRDHGYALACLHSWSSAWNSSSVRTPPSCIRFLSIRMGSWLLYPSSSSLVR